MEKYQRSVLLFKNTVKSDKTFEKYLYYLNKFKQYYKLRDFDSMISMDHNQLQIMIEDYTMDLKSKNLAKSTINVILHSLQAFFEINDADIRWKKIRRLMPAQGKKSGKHAWATQDIQLMLSHTPEIRSKALIHFLSSTGVRIGAIPDIKLRNIKEMPNECRSVHVYADDKEEYYTFLTPEATQSLDRYLKKRQNDGEYLKPESPLFRTKYVLGMAPARRLGRDGLIGIIVRALYRSGLRQTKDNSRRDIPQNHGFRKRFNTILKTTPNINSNLVEKMMGQD